MYMLLSNFPVKIAFIILNRSGHIECVETLLEACPIPLNDDDIDDMTPLLLASENGHHKVVRFLIKMGADIANRLVDTDKDDCMVLE